jgi:hypothetical protein
MFLNLNDLWDNDEDFPHKGDLHPAIMDVGVYKGGRYVIPLSYRTNILLGERGSLESVGFNVEDNADLFAFYNMLALAEPIARENPSFIKIMPFIGEHYMATDIFTGIPLIDFERGTVLPEEAAIRAFVEAFKPFFGMMHWEQNFTGTEDLLEQMQILFNNFNNQPSYFVYPYNRLKMRGLDPVLTPLRNYRGELHATVMYSVAIRASSPNHLNAWNYIKLMLSEDFQGDDRTYMQFGGAVVNRNAFEALVESRLNKRHFREAQFLTSGYSEVSMEEKEPFLEMHRNITSVSFRNFTLKELFEEAIEPYYMGEQSLDEAIEGLRRKLRLYISE